ncbi:hypothetical protein JX266_011633 [Neoarthrinium moseri]|uniref:uncharacterized protein n=1 Tax=Neoarthrinium moseri TaxID=1658444 RepID=UPI001FDD4DF3|nr:uncharacterized protein JN550_009837 [Neoarthrinium moseri]KAI1842225.1 hypothetical protein JX266_011633 [Neoarthrinium moseri]KAI1863101.1 hypothetical protein JN550_009837 [Neoarthrinium moseri]
MDRRYSFDSDPGEHAPLDNPNRAPSSSSPLRNNQYPQQHHRSDTYQAQPPPYYHDDPASSSRNPNLDSPGRSGNRPGVHPQSDFTRLRDERRRSRGYEAVATGAGVGATAAAAAASTAGRPSPRGAPQPPLHREDNARSAWTSGGQSNITPGADNFGETAAGGLAGIASTVAERNARQSGLEAMRAAEGYGQRGYHGQAYDQSQHQGQQYGQQPYGYDRGYDQGYDQGYDHTYGQAYDRSQGGRHDPYGGHGQYQDSSPSLGQMSAGAIPSGAGTPARSQRSHASDPFRDPYHAYGQRLDPGMGQVNPNDIMDDGDDGLEYTRRSARNSMLSLGNTSNRGANAAGGAAAGGAAAGALMGARDHYAPVKGGSGYAAGDAKEQSAWIKKQQGSSKKWKWLIIILVGLVIAGAIAGGVVGGVLANKNKAGSSSSSSGGGGQSASEDTQENGDLDINSDEIKALLNNKNLHKVFPGVDYTPLNTQYPDCLSNPPSQNNITRDVAVLSQLTNVIRLYGTDCNQTEMTIHALNQLKMQNDIKIWLGVWQDGNETTNARQLEQMWTILDTYGDSPFKGLIVANEILFREEMTLTELGTLLDGVRTNLTSKGLSLPVATSDLGDNWDSNLASKSDYIMSNIHPFFGGINAKEAASWTYTFWTTHDAGFTKSDASKNVISEIGWPSQGGMDCASETITDCPEQAVAGIDELNQLLSDWVCPALDNGTNYFWFEMFDEPWKIKFNTKSQNWEDHWGLMDVNRNLKDGIKIPDCGGKTV